MCEWAAVRFSRELEPLLTSDIVTIGEACCGEWCGVQKGNQVEVPDIAVAEAEVMGWLCCVV